MQIVDSVVNTLEDQRGARVAAVSIRVGAMSGVIPEALGFAWDVATQGSPLAGAALRIDHIPAAVHCPSCEREIEIAGYKMRCPVCDTPTPRIVRGRELDILSLELHDDTPAQAAADH